MSRCAASVRSLSFGPRNVTINVCVVGSIETMTLLTDVSSDAESLAPKSVVLMRIAWGSVDAVKGLPLEFEPQEERGPTVGSSTAVEGRANPADEMLNPPLWVELAGRSIVCPFELEDVVVEVNWPLAPPMGEKAAVSKIPIAVLLLEAASVAVCS